MFIYPLCAVNVAEPQFVFRNRNLWVGFYQRLRPWRSSRFEDFGFVLKKVDVWSIRNAWQANGFGDSYY